MVSLEPGLAELVEEHRFRTKALLEASDFAGAAAEGSRALDVLPDLAAVSILRGHALLTPLFAKIALGEPTLCRQDFKGAYEAFRLALVIDPANAEARAQLQGLGELLQRLPDFPPGQEAVEVGPNFSQQKPSAEMVIDAPAPDGGAHTHSHSHSHPDAGLDEDAVLASVDAERAAERAKIEEYLQDQLDAKSDTMFDVIIVGAGAAGIGAGVTLTKVFGLDPSRVLLLERGEAVGKSFRMWPNEMRFISPSFNQQGWTNSFDLNSVAYGTSPAFTLHAQHPSGEQYADYLDELVEAAELNVKTRAEVLKVSRRPQPPPPGGCAPKTRPNDGEVFDVHMRTGSAEGVQREETYHARYIVWAAGEFQYPRERPAAVAGAELCVHNSRVQSWASLPGDDFVIIGGFESGADAAVNLSKAGKQCTVLASTGAWDVQAADPSTELSPYTAQRLHEVTAAGFSPKPQLLALLRVLRVERAAAGGFDVVATWKAAEPVQLSKLRWKARHATVGDTALAGGFDVGAEGSELVVHTAQPPVLCTGFTGSVAAAARELFHLADESDAAKGCLAGAPLLTDADESTKTPGVFLVGPQVRHGEHSFCFIYKFRQRFGIVANAICTGLGRDTTSAVESSRKMNMFLDDLTCCKATCGSTC